MNGLLKTSFWVTAEIIRCNGLFMPMTVLHKGDADRGLVLLKQYIAGEGAIAHAQRRNMDGHLGWVHPLGDDPITEAEVDEYMSRQRGYDEDLWLIEVEDPKKCYIPPEIC